MIEILMPYSSESGKSVIRTILKRLDKLVYKGSPLKALDIGCGSGTYPKLVRDCVTSRINWVGVEIWEPYIEQFKLSELYDDIMIMPAQDAVKQLTEPFDLIFIGDVLEHMSREVALEVIANAKKLLSHQGVLVVSVPIGEYPQGEYLGNPYEAHVDTWASLQELYDALNVNVPNVDNVPRCTLDNEIGVGFYMPTDVTIQLAPKIAAYMICKDEEHFISRCINSLKDVDSIIIADTGSTDGTLEIILSHIEECNWAPELYPSISVHEICVSPWRFDDARNIALGFVPTDIDLCISIDSDETLEANFVAEISGAFWDSLWEGKPITRVYHSFMTNWTWDKPTEPSNITKHFHERVHSRFGYRWIHPVHEKLVAEAEVAVWRASAFMLQRPDTAKPRSYLTMLEQAVKEDPTDWKIWSFLANDQASIGLINEALTSLATCALQPGADAAFIAWRKAAIYEWQGKINEAMTALQQAIDIQPIREAFVMLAELCERHPNAYRNDVARGAWEAAKGVTQETQGYMRREDVWAPNFKETLTAKTAPLKDAQDTMLALYEDKNLSPAEKILRINKLLGVDLAAEALIEADGSKE